MIDKMIESLKWNNSIKDIYVKEALYEVTHMKNWEQSKSFIEALYPDGWTEQEFKEWLVVDARAILNCL